MNLDNLANAMIAELAMPKSNSVDNNLRLVQQEMPSLKRVLLIIKNKYTELQRMFRHGEKTRKEANAIIRDQLLEEIRAAAQGKAGVVPEGSEKRSDDLNPEVQFENHPLDRYKDSKDAIAHAVMTEGSVLTSAPILPLVKPFLDPDKLRSVGIPFSKYEGYIILDSQLVAGISNEQLTKKLGAYAALKEGFDEIVKLGKLAYKVRNNADAYNEAVQNLRARTLGVLSQLDRVKSVTALETKLRGLTINYTKPATYTAVIATVHKVCEELKAMLDALPSKVTAESIYSGMLKNACASTGKKLNIVGKPSLSLGASWLWLMTDKEINSFGKCSVGGHCTIVKWGLAFTDK